MSNNNNNTYTESPWSTNPIYPDLTKRDLITGNPIPPPIPPSLPPYTIVIAYGIYRIIKRIK